MKRTTVNIGGHVELDVAILLKTRLLIQANSGGGKSWLIRRLAEQLFGVAPVIIIDPEGEFSTLREKFGFVLVGKGGETPADPRSAKLVAHKLLELQASAVIDLYEVSVKERHHYVKLFLEALVDAPKTLWRPTFIIVDEAHTFCPEKGQGESEAAEPMTALSTRGRKRRFCAIWATQRLAKLNKSATAELLNRLIGPTFEDVDLKRAADLLSISKEDRREWEKQMRILEPGNFYAIGRAIGKERVLVKVGPVQTTHEDDSAQPGLPPPPTPEKIKGLLPKLADLPKEAEEKLQTEAALRAEIRTLKQQLAMAPKAETKRIEIPILDKTASDLLDRISGQFDDTAKQLGELIIQVRKLSGPRPAASPISPLTQFCTPATRRPVTPPVAAPATNGHSSEIGGGLRRMMIALAQRPGLSKRQLGVRAGLSSTSGTFGTYLSRLRNNGWIDGSMDGFELTPAGRQALGDYGEPLPEGPDLYRYWMRELGESGAARILQVLFEAYPQRLAKEELGARAGMSSTSGTFGTYLSRLRTLELIEGRSELAATKEFFE